uniref:Protein phosphatase n=1 Tax=Cannabis sativa TaxID=3483 RepID=A0A803PWA4_CANSA
MKMVCEACYGPKDHLLGEDAHFVCSTQEIIGVADGVDGWAKKGIDAGEYARQLMLNSIHEVIDNEITNPKIILEQAFMENASSRIQGSSTACIIHHNNGVLQTVNVGDITQQKTFNMPYQLGNAKGCDTPRVAVEAKVEVELEDVIILGTDGVWDNIFVWEMEQVLKEKIKNMDLKNLSSYIASLALYNSFDKFRKTPFSIASTEAGKPCRGGKFDDITVYHGVRKLEYESFGGGGDESAESSGGPVENHMGETNMESDSQGEEGGKNRGDKGGEKEANLNQEVELQDSRKNNKGNNLIVDISDSQMEESTTHRLDENVLVLDNKRRKSTEALEKEASVQDRFEVLKKRRVPGTFSEQDLDERILKQQQEEEERKRQRREKKKEKKKEKAAEEEPEMDPDVAAMMGFGGFGSSKK